MWWMVILELLHYTLYCILRATHTQTVITFSLTHGCLTVELQGNDTRLYLTSRSAKNSVMTQAARYSVRERAHQATSKPDSHQASTQASESQRQSACPSARQGSAGIDGTGTKPVGAPYGGAVVIHLPASPWTWPHRWAPESIFHITVSPSQKDSLAKI